MVRARNLKPGFFLNVDLGSGDPLRQILFEGLWCVADRSGRLEDQPLKIKAQILPYRDCDPDKILSSLVPEFILRYERNDKRYIQILNFNKHQNPHIKETESTIPAPDKHHKSTGKSKTSTIQKLLIPSSLIPDSLIPSSLIPDSNKQNSSEPEKSQAHEPPVLTFQTVGKISEWFLFQSKIDEYKESFPGVDVALECRKARQWCIDNPTRRKTFRGMTKFLGSWLSRAQNSSKGGSNGSDQSKPVVGKYED